MHYLSLRGRTPAAIPAQALICHDVRDPQDRTRILVRKGAPVTGAELVELLGRDVAELHVAVPDPDDVGEDEAAARLGSAVAGALAEPGPAKFGQVTFRAAARGMFRVDRAALARVNALPDVLLLTAEAERAVEAGTTLGVVKCAPLLLPAATIDAVAALGTVLDVHPFTPRRVALVMPTTRVRGNAFERAHQALGTALAWYGSAIDPLLPTDGSLAAQADAYEAARAARVDFILSAGASATDPLDVVFEGLRRAGGAVDQIGIAAEPGTACWIGHLDTVPVLGLASCELFGQPGALDLLLPRLLSGEPLDRAMVASLADGGLLLGPSRIAPYHAQPDG